MLTFHRRWVSVTVTGAIVAVLLFSGFYAWAASGAATGAVGSSGAPANNAGPAPTASATPAPRLHGGGPARAVLGERGRPNLPGLAPPAARTPAAAVHLAGGGGLPKTAWTTSLVNGSVSVGDVVGAIGIEPLGVAYDPSRGELFVADWASDTVTVLGASNGTVLATVPVGTGPVALAYASASGEVFVANQFSNDVSILSDATNSLVTTVDVGVAPSAIAYDPARAELFVANNGSGNVSVLSATSGASLASITVGSHPSGVAYDAVLGGVAVSNWASNSVSLVSDVTDTVLATVGVGAGPAGLAIVPSNGTVLVAASGAGEVDLVSVANDSFAGSVPVGLGPSAIAWDPTTAVAYVVAGGSDNVSLVSVATLAVVGTTAVGVLPEGIAYDAAQGELFVANAYSNNVSALADRNGSVVASYPLGAFPMGLAYDGTQHAVYVASADANVLSAIADSNDVPRPVAGLGLGADGVAYDSARGELFVANNLSDTVSVVSATSGSVVASIPVGVGPAAVAYDPAKGEVFVANENNTSDSVSVISDATNTVVATVPVGDGPIALAYDPAKGEVFVANNGSGTVSVISDATDHVVATITVGLYPDGVAYDNGTSQLFVANGGSDTVSVLSDVSNTVTKTVTVGFFPAGLAYDSGQHEVYVADELSNNVSVIADGSDTVLATVPVGLTPTAVAYDPATAEVFVANPDSGTVSVLTDGTARAFSAQLTVKTTDSTGAPLAGATVRVDGQTAVTGAGGSTEFLLPNGSYVVNATESGYLSANASVSVAGTGSVALTLGFPYHYLGVIPPADLNITATDAGVQVALRGLFAASPADVYFDWKHVGILAAGAGWTDFLTTALPSLIVVGAQHGSSDYPNAYYARPTTLPGAGCGAVPATSGIGLPITVNPDPPVYGSPTLVTVGLHNSCPYALSIQELIVEYADFNIGGAVFNPIGTFHNISLPVNASDNLSLLWNTTFNAAEYGYHHCLRIQIIYGSPVPPQGNFISGLHNLDIEPNTVAGHAGSVDFTVRNPDAMTEPVEIVVVSAMPAGWSTSVVLNGEPEAASPFYVTLDAGQQVSGTLTIQPSGHTPGNGTVQIQEYIGSELIGGLEKKLQELPPGKFPVDFTESGLPSGVAWSVTFNGQTLSTHGPTIYANATNASYPFTVTPPTGYNAKPLSGTVNVNGAAVTQKVQFALPGGVYCGEISAPLIASGSVPIPFGSDDSPVSIEFDGGVSLTPTLSVCLGTKTVLGFIPEPTFLNITESLDESASASITASGTASFNDLDDPDEFGDFQLGCYPIGPVPVCLSAAIDLGIAADFTASVSVSMTQGIHLQASQNYSFETDRWTSVPVQETCSGAGESLAYGCLSFSAGASISGSLEMRIGPKIDISAAHLVG
ncbi:MAG TPA: hypothetical protein VMH49_05815, partial [Thermoplasmata archaeon]|nr:hypothetical protein [Thermoplasmata archaeon]